MITLRFTSVDRHSWTRRYKTLAGAQKRAWDHIGRHPEMSSHYAISDDGVVKVTCSGTTLYELFPDEADDATSFLNYVAKYDREIDDSLTMPDHRPVIESLIEKGLLARFQIGGHDMLGLTEKGWVEVTE